MTTSPRFDIRGPLHRVSGTDLAQLDGIGPYNAPGFRNRDGYVPLAQRGPLHLLAHAGAQEQGVGWTSPQLAHPASANRAAAILRLAVMSLSRGQTALGAFYRRLAYRIGRAKAITATARKLAVLVYRTLKGGFLYKDPGADAYDKHYRDRAVQRLRQRAEFLGFALVSRQTGEIS